MGVPQVIASVVFGQIAILGADIDGDGDGVSDGDEILNGTNPLAPPVPTMGAPALLVLAICLGLLGGRLRVRL
jgi:hypothetical protein